MKIFVRNVLRKCREALKPSSARAVEALAREIRLDTQRLLAEELPLPDSNGKGKKKEDPDGVFSVPVPAP